jgi:hypothetical protein
MANGHGGRRTNSGRKVGRLTVRTQEIAAELAKDGVTPLEYMLGVMRDDNADAGRRDDMAKSAAPYMHPRLSAIDIDASINLDGLTDEELEFLARIRAKTSEPGGDTGGTGAAGA